MVNIRKLTDDLQKIACDELNEVPERIQDDVDALRTWLKQATHIKSRDDDQFLVTFLRSCKYSLEKAKLKIEAYYVTRTGAPELFGTRDPSDKFLQEILNLGYAIPLPIDETKSAPRIQLIRLGGYDYNKYDFISILKVAYMTGDWCTKNSDVSIIAGQISILDLSDVSIAMGSIMTPSLIKTLAKLLDSYPVRVKAVHFVNGPKAAEPLFRLFMSFCSEKLRRRHFVHKSLEELYKHVDKKHLPVEYGGSNKSIPIILDNWREKLINERDWFLDDVKYRADKLNNPNATNGGSGFGVVGSFRSLSID